MTDLVETDEVVEKKGLIPRSGSSKLARKFNRGLGTGAALRYVATHMAGMPNRAENDLHGARKKAGRRWDAGRYLETRNRAHGHDAGTGRGRYGPTRRGIYKSASTDNVVEAFYDVVEKASGLMRLSNKRNQFRLGSGTHRAAKIVTRGRDKMERRLKNNAWTGIDGGKTPSRRVAGSFIGRSERALNYLRRRAKRNANTKGSGYDDR